LNANITILLSEHPELVEKYGNSTFGRIAPHGIIAQSFDGNKFAVSGKLDTYGSAKEFTTSAQAEGAIEGRMEDYIVATPFSADFRFSRFNMTEPVAPHNVSLLAGIKAISTRVMSAASMELHGVEPN
jgi:hypothetical protein